MCLRGHVTLPDSRLHRGRRLGSSLSLWEPAPAAAGRGAGRRAGGETGDGGAGRAQGRGWGARRGAPYLRLPPPVLLPRGVASRPLLARVDALFMAPLSVPLLPFLGAERTAFLLGTLLSPLPRAALFPVLPLPVWLLLLPGSPLARLSVQPVLEGVVLAVAILQLWM